ncbi:glycerophosphoryl diester phosphodiesterase [Brevibacterium sanguinis]|uniref:Glycerophosphoryl diester phosphodiesterase n=2 Tax=Brevibacterium TaxID=1696 RepID=A0A366IP31_9MICO|nr:MULTISPECIES: glycerophosphodiester phosphodiesterase family protein [Brevibacterium]RBP66447.1 glycerophosphoryl diester phosphodiesterase [Brevibacterium sanguinis]RBP73099.1 glycerophosphoryl diester phosphodiesterase [Brevibacterium celere]
MSLILATVAGIACAPKPSGPVVDAEYPILAAHRGGSHVWPQNTMTAFRAALAARPGVALETDVRALKDGTLVLAHYDTVDQISANGETGRVADMTPAQWSALRIKSPTGGTSAPAATLNDLLTEYGGTDTVLVIEVKDPALVNAFIEAVWPHRQQVIAQSFDPATVKRLVKSGLHVLQLGDYSTVQLIPGIHSVGVQTLNITPDLISRAHEQGAKVWAWGNEVTTAQYAAHDRGLDGYMVNDPR